MSNKGQAVAFDRVSSDDQRREGFSLEAQEKLGGRYAREKHLNVVRRWSVSESASKEDERKHFFEMIEYVKENEIKDVLFDKVDRACRGLKSAQMIEDLIEKRSVRFHFTRDQLVIDENSPSSEKLRFYLNVILAKYYIDNLKTEIKKGMSERQESGFWNFKAPIGYKNVREGKNGRASVELDDETAPHVRQVFELYATGNYNLRELTRYLNQCLDGRTVTKTCIEWLLANPFYYGAMKVQGSVLAGKHAPLITKDLWDACQKIKGIRGERAQLNLSQLLPKPFMGLMECGACRHRVTGEVKRKASGKVYIYYHCANSKCPEVRNSTSQARIEEQIIEAFAPFSKLTPDGTREFIKTIQSNLENIEFYSRKKVSDLTDRRTESKRSLEKIEKLHRDGLLTEPEYQELLKLKQTSLAESEVEIHAALKADSKTFSAGLNIIELISISNDFMKLSGDSLEKARLAKFVLSNPTLIGGTLRYGYKKPFDDLIELTDRKKWWR